LRHSGALLVGASGMGDRLPADFSNVSARVDVHAWGSGVVTIGYGDGDAPPFDSSRPISRSYTRAFSGTSSASAIVAGAVCCLQGVRRASGRTPLSPIELEVLLKSTGTPQEGSQSQRDARPIGSQPDLRAALTRALTAGGGFSGAGVYTIRAKHSGKMLDVDIGWFRGQDDGQPVVQFGFHGGLNQQFEVVGVQPGPYWIVPRHSRNKVIQVAQASGADGAPLQQWAMRSGAPEQLFLIEPIGGHFRIVATHNGKVLDVAALSHEDSARIQQWTWWGGDNQLWEFTPVRPEGRR
jgi:Ricin-type beta-trefoil lectin domain-like